MHLRHSRWIKALARQFSSSDNDLADDLEQEGNIALWSIASDAPGTISGLSVEDTGWMSASTYLRFTQSVCKSSSSRL